MPALPAVLLETTIIQVMSLPLTLISGYRKYLCIKYGDDLLALFLWSSDYTFTIRKKVVSDSSSSILSLSLSVTALFLRDSNGWVSLHPIIDTFLTGSIINVVISYLLFCFHTFSSHVPL